MKLGIKSRVLFPVLLSGFLLTSDNHKITYDHYQNGHDKLVIIAHGFYCSKDATFIRNLANSLSGEYDVFTFDFRGHGKSGGLFTWTSLENRDLEAVFRHLEGKYKKTGMIAFSLGASITIDTLAEKKWVDSLVCISVVSDVNKIDFDFQKMDWRGDLGYTLFTRDGQKGRGFRPGPWWLKKRRAIDEIDKIKIPVLYIHGQKDWVVKPWHSEALYAKTNSHKKLVIINDGPHAEYLVRDNYGEFVSEIKDWFKSTL